MNKINMNENYFNHFAYFLSNNYFLHLFPEQQLFSKEDASMNFCIYLSALGDFQTVRPCGMVRVFPLGNQRLGGLEKWWGTG